VAHHEIPATPENMVLGYLDATQKPVLEIDSGDTVTLHSFPAGGHEILPEASRVPADYMAALTALPAGPGPHFITGPVYVRGAKPGDTLQVDILEATPRMDWGFVAIMPLLGTLPDEFTDYETIHPAIDRARGTGEPQRPQAFGGNMDNKERPVFNDGALFMAGDGHGVQGDGEVCITALETGLTGTFRLTIRRDYPVDFPFAETPTHLMSIGLDEDLDDAAKQAVRQMILHVCRRTNLSRNQAYMLCSLIGDLRVTQTVDGNKGIHMLLAKTML
jgi:acetamidase/formamidase